MNDLCVKCGQEVNSNCFEKCDECMGLITDSEIQKMSPVDRRELRLVLDKVHAQANFNRTSIIHACKHEEVDKGELIYDSWRDLVYNTYDPKYKFDYAKYFYDHDTCHAFCQICGKDFGWYCPDSPLKYCQYPENWNEEQKYGVSAAYCVFCKKPHNRYAKTKTELYQSAFAEVGIVI